MYDFVITRPCLSGRSGANGFTMLRCLLLVVLSLAASVACAQRALASPALSAFTRGGIPTISVDPSFGWIYASGFSTRAMGLTRYGLARVTPDGVIDSGWQPSGLFQVFSHVAAQNGDLYVHGFETLSGPRVIARYSPAESNQPIAIYREASSVSTPNNGVNAIYGGRSRYVFYSDNGNTLKRIDTTTGLVDPTWSYFTSQQLVSVSQGAGVDGAIFVLERQYPGLVRDMYVRRLDAGATAAVLWTKTFPVEDASVAASDLGDRIYVATRRSFSFAEATIQRLNSNGDNDLLWDGRAASEAISQSARNRVIAVVDDQLVVPAYVNATSSVSGHAGLRRFNQSGAELARWATPLDSPIDKIVDGHNGRLYVSTYRALQVLDSKTLQPQRALTLTFGSLGSVAAITALPDGGRLFTGNFDVWYGGVRFQSILRTRPDGTPDTTWRVETDTSYSMNATVTPLGVLLIGGFTRVNGVARAGAALISLGSEAIVAAWQPDTRLGALVFDGNDWLYYTAYEGSQITVRRVSLISGQTDSAWRIVAAQAEEWADSSLGMDRAGGIWLTLDAQTSFGEPFTTSRIIRIDPPTRQLAGFTDVRTQLVYPRPFMATSEHVYIGDRRYRIADGGALDPSWKTLREGVSPTLRTIAGGYMYFAYYDAVPDYVTGGAIVERAALSGNGQTDPTWTARTKQMVTCATPEVPVFATSTSATLDAAEFLIRCRDDVSLGRAFGDMVMATSRNDAFPDKTVVEYFNRNVGRYFVTGRANEQALLDAQSASFARTGMQFRARDSTYRDRPETPVCRLYAAPEAGGSNTHFHGTGEDCTVLNTVSQLRFEGFDFAVIKPASSVCPADAPNAVTRLFNNKAATNEGNHRYVVSAATKAKMLTQGWIDEGAVFCSAGVADAVN